MRRLAAVALVLAAGCATPLPPPAGARATQAYEARRAALTPLTSWEIDGRLALRADDRGWQASLRWQRDRDRHRIDLSGPLGGGHVRLSADRDGARLREPGRKTYYARDASVLLRRVTGWDVPLAGMNYWVLGLPVPHQPAVVVLDARGRVTDLRQAGWDVEFLRYARYGRWDLPSKLYVRRLASAADGTPPAGPARAPVELRLVINRWDLRD